MGVTEAARSVSIVKPWFLEENVAATSCRIAQRRQETGVYLHLCYSFPYSILANQS
jgi:hypothetical protein